MTLEMANYILNNVKDPFKDYDRAREQVLRNAGIDHSISKILASATDGIEYKGGEDNVSER